MLEGKNIQLGVCGSIASYKSAILVRLLVKAGANVKVIMTKDATHFITPLTLSTLSKNPVFSSYYKEETGEWNNHVDLALWADVLLIAPMSANTLGKFANGICDNLLSAVYLSAKCPVLFAPAMDLDMWKHPATQQNVLKLTVYKNTMISPAVGELASGLVGEGRMAEPEEILSFLKNHFSEGEPLAGKKVLVTAGPTYEQIDPVRFIGNHSSGKMGFALAEEFCKKGAEVILVSGPTHLALSDQKVKRVDITSAAEMAEQVFKHFEQSDIIVMSAAVADYRPKEVAEVKIKKEKPEFSIEMVKTTDILSEMGRQKKDYQMLVGFALETNNEVENAISKLKKKNLDFIVLNSLKDQGAGFKGDSNKISIIDKNFQIEHFELKTKKEVAVDISNKVIELLK